MGLAQLKVVVERFARVTRLQGEPCLNQQRGDRGRVPDEPYGESSPLPPPRTTLCGWRGNGDSERGRRKGKVGEAREGHSTLPQATSRSPRH